MGSKVPVEGKLFDISDFFLILVTKDSSIPTNEIRESIDCIGKVEATEKEIATDKIYWTNWQKINPVLEEIIERFPEESFERKISQQLYDFLDKRDLILFTGFDFLDSCSLEPTTVTNESIFYHAQKRTYWSRELFKDPLLCLKGKDPLLCLKGSNIFYTPTIKQHWKDITKN